MCIYVIGRKNWGEAAIYVHGDAITRSMKRLDMGHGGHGAVHGLERGTGYEWKWGASAARPEWGRVIGDRVG